MNRARSRFLMVFAPLLIACLVAVAAYLYADASRVRMAIERDEARLVNRLVQHVEDMLNGVHGDVRYLAQQPLVREFLQGRGGLFETLGADYARFADSRKVYAQIRLLDTQGRERVRVNRTGERFETVEASALSDKSGRYYFQEAMSTPTGRVYVSPFDLNIEHGEIEDPPVPVIRFATAVDAPGGERLGIVVVNFDGRPLLRLFEQLAGESAGEVWLLNRRGYWLFSPNEANEWGFMRSEGSNLSLAEREPGLWTIVKEAGQLHAEFRGDLLTRAKVCGVSGCEADSASSSVQVHHLPYDAEDLPWTIVSRLPAGVVSGLGLVSPRVGVLLGFVGVLSLIATLSGVVAWRLAGALESLRAKENALSQSEERFRTLLEAAPDAIIIVDANGDIAHVNRRASEYFGYSRDTLLTLSVDDLVPRDARARHEAERKEYMKHPDTRVLRSAVDLRGLRADGSEFPVEISLAPARTDDGVKIIAVVRDKSAQLELETQFRQTQKMEAIGQLTGGMAHDFNNLLAIVIGSLDLVDQNLADDDEARKRIGTARKAALRGADLTRRMLAVARRQSLRPSATSVNQVVEELAGILPRTLGPGTELSTRLGENLPSVMVDPSELENALLNLAINARDAMAGGGHLYIRTDSIDLDDSYPPVFNGDIKPGTYVRISVTDTGAGMSRDTLARAFEPFFTTKERGKGTGLGLAMIYGFIRQSRGNVRIYSEPGEGTTVNIYLPALDQPLPARDAEDADAPVTLRGRECILVVDDEIDLLEIAARYLEEHGYRVYAASDGPSALEMLNRQGEIDLLLTDVVMPGGLHGVALAEEARRLRPGIRVLYTSGFPSNVLADKAEIHIDAPLIGKPYRKEDLLRRVRESLDTV